MHRLGDRPHKHSVASFYGRLYGYCFRYASLQMRPVDAKTGCSYMDFLKLCMVVLLLLFVYLDPQYLQHVKT